jgi:2-desacetyl-2-hydroxyethyl bacteriochlorophyllide A dehydrogenase
MRAVAVRGPRDAAVVEVPTPSPAAGQVLVRVAACGVCGSDLNAWRGVPGIEYPLPPGAPGHEIWGEVVELGAAVNSIRVGQTVTGLLWNGFAELGVGRADDLVVVPDGLDGTVILGEPLACAMNVVRRSALQPDDRVAVVGFGYLAALVVQLLPANVGGWLAVSRREESRALAMRLGAVAAYDFSTIPTPLWDSFPVVIEASGVQQTLDYATWLTAVGGRLVIAGYHADGPRTVNMQSWNWKGIDVINAHEREPQRYVSALREGLDLVTARRVDLASLQTHTWPLERAAEAFRLAEERPAGFIKGMLCP